MSAVCPLSGAKRTSGPPCQILRPEPAPLLTPVPPYRIVGHRAARRQRTGNRSNRHAAIGCLLMRCAAAPPPFGGPRRSHGPPDLWPVHRCVVPARQVRSVLSTSRCSPLRNMGLFWRATGRDAFSPSASARIGIPQRLLLPNGVLVVVRFRPTVEASTPWPRFGGAIFLEALAQKAGGRCSSAYR